MASICKEHIRNEDNFSVQVQSLDGGFHLVSEIGSWRDHLLKKNPSCPRIMARLFLLLQLDDLVSYLMIAARKATEQPASKHNWEDESL